MLVRMTIAVFGMILAGMSLLMLRGGSTDVDPVGARNPTAVGIARAWQLLSATVVPFLWLIGGLALLWDAASGGPITRNLGD